LCARAGRPVRRWPLNSFAPSPSLRANALVLDALPEDVHGGTGFASCHSPARVARAASSAPSYAPWAAALCSCDRGQSGTIAPKARPKLGELMQAVARREVDLVAAWGVDRLGRSLQDLLTLLGELHAKGVDLYLHRQGLDTTTPAGKALFSMLGVFAEFERALIVERVKAGMARAHEKGTRSGRPIGRPRIDVARERRIRELRRKGLGMLKIAREVGVGASVVQRVLGAR